MFSIIMISSLMHKVFRYQKLSETPKCSPTHLFGTVDKILFIENYDIPVLHSFNVPETFRNTKKFPHDIVPGRQKVFDNFL